MSTTGKVITGILSFLPIVLLLGQFIVFFSFFYQLISHSIETGSANPDGKEFLLQMGIMVANIALVIVVGIGMLIYLLVHASRNPSFNDDDRLTWIILLVLMGIIIYPIYWYMVIRKDKPADPVIK